MNYINTMKYRKNILPRRWNDLVCILMAFIFIPSLFVFEVSVVVPAIHEPGGFLHLFTLVAASFIFMNVMGNLLACILVDTSVDYASAKPVSRTWRYCDECKRLAPPRSWHCKVCRSCILKRDHHCLFTACCIGHRNQRYFIVFLTFLFIGSVYAFIYNSFYFWVLEGHVYLNWFSVFKMLCPILVFASGLMLGNCYLVLYNMNILGMIYASTLLLYHIPTLFRGGVCYNRQSHFYDYGWQTNLRNVFGERMLSVWLAPFVSSGLLNDGTEWRVYKNGEQEKTK